MFALPAGSVSSVKRGAHHSSLCLHWDLVSRGSKCGEQRTAQPRSAAWAQLDTKLGMDTATAAQSQSDTGVYTVQKWLAVAQLRTTTSWRTGHSRWGRDKGVETKEPDRISHQQQAKVSSRYGNTFTFNRFIHAFFCLVRKTVLLLDSLWNEACC